MSSLQRVVSLILFAVGGLLALLGLTSLVQDAPPDVSAEARRGMTQAFVAAGVVGIGLIALGVYVRARRLGGGQMTGLWVAYLLFWGVLAGLVVFVWQDLVNLVPAGDALLIVIYLVAFLGAPVLEVIARLRGRPAAAEGPTSASPK